VAWAKVYVRTKWHLHASSRLATIDMGRKLGAVPLLGEELGPHVTQHRLQGRGLPPYQVTSQFIQLFGHNGHGLKIGGCAPLGGGGARSPSNTMSPGLRHTSVPSGILMHQALWPQLTWTENLGLCRFFQESRVSV